MAAATDPDQTDAASAPAVVTVRPTRPEDAAAFGRIHVAAWDAAYRGIFSDATLDAMTVARSTEKWATIIDDTATLEAYQPSQLFTGELNGEAVGMASAGVAREPAAPGTGELHVVNVRPEAWSVGVGSQLVTAAVEYLRSVGYVTAFLWVVSRNDRAISFYERHGWQMTDDTKVDDSESPPVSEHRMIITL